MKVIQKVSDLLFIAVSKAKIRCPECGSAELELNTSDIELCLQCRECDTLLLMAQSRV